MSGVLRLSNNVTGRSTIIASASNDQTFTLPALGGTLLAGGSSLEVIFPPGTEALPGLHVQGDLDTGLYAPAANTLGISTAGSERMRIDSSGNVGIGTTSNLLSSATRTTLSLNNTGSSAIAFGVNGTREGHLYADANSVELSAQDNYMYFTAGSAERMRIDSSGNVGIGTSSPNAALTVHGSAGNAKIRLGQGGDHTIIGPDASGHTVINAGTSGGNMQFETAGTERMRINSSGNVGIGTTSPDVKLHVETSGPTTTRISGNRGNSADLHIGSIEFENTFGTQGVIAEIKAITGSSGTQSTQGQLSFYTDNGSSYAERLRIDSSGNVGIGNADPGTMLHVSDSTDDATFRVGGNNAGDTGFNVLYENGGTTYTILKQNYATTNANAYTSIHTGYFTVNTGTSLTERMRIDSSGNVGIGTSNPGNLIEALGTDAGVAVHYSGNCYGGIAALSSGRLALVTGNINDDIVFGYSDYALSSGSFVQRMKINNGSGAVNITGALSKGSGSFKISHPLPSKTDTHHLVHSFIEGPQADLIYRGYVDLVDGQATVNIDTAARMTEGTFEVLCTNVSCFTSNESDWTAVKGSVTGNILTITAQDATSTSKVSWMVVGERKDPHMLETNWTDENGRVITEPLKNED